MRGKQSCQCKHHRMPADYADSSDECRHILRRIAVSPVTSAHRVTPVGIALMMKLMVSALIAADSLSRWACLNHQRDGRALTNAPHTTNARSLVDRSLRSRHQHRTCDNANENLRHQHDSLSLSQLGTTEEAHRIC